MVCTELNRRRIGTCGGLLWTRNCIFWFHWRQGVSWQIKWLSVPQEWTLFHEDSQWLKNYSIRCVFAKCSRNFARSNNNSGFFPCKLANSQNQSPIREAVVYVFSDSGLRSKMGEKKKLNKWAVKDGIWQKKYRYNGKILVWKYRHSSLKHVR